MLRTATTRQTYILEIVREQGFASIEQLAVRFDVTQQTIRRLVNALCDQGLLRRVHGGVGLPVQNQNLAYGSRHR
jgi:DeoR family glycerol-3-phosphate regulon repressor